MNTRWCIGVGIAGLSLVTSLGAPVDAKAFEARGIVSPGLPYEDVYGVFLGGRSLARNTNNGLSSIDIVNSDGTVAFESNP